MTTPTEQVDVLIVGAGLSGIGAAAQLGANFPTKKIVVLESREANGGTWDLFKYPGIRSDSDMFTFGYKWDPWPGEQALADGHHILSYLRKVAEKWNVDEKIRYRHKVISADWSSKDKRWTVVVDTPDGERTFATRFLWSCAGYYDYDHGHEPEFPGRATYKGQFIYPQFWPEDLDYAGKNVVVIGSGATAVTLIPNMADEVGHITMLQRTPTYILSRPGKDLVAVGIGSTVGKLPKMVPFRTLRERAGFEAVRWANVMLQISTFSLARTQPDTVKKIIREGIIRSLTGVREKYMTRDEAVAIVEEHFTPPYQPWDQRLCFVPDGDLFKAIRTGKASVVTDRIKTFTADGIELESGATLPADIVIAATGLRIKLFGGVEVSVDGVRIPPSDTLTYKGLALTGIPNFLFTIGYTNASWTLKADLVSDYAVKLLKHMEKKGYEQFVVERDYDGEVRPLMDMQSGYLQRAAEQMPRAGDRAPWGLKQNYLVDVKTITGSIVDRPLTFA
ncbi:MAG TPA: NAD(P)/FAD-dependent oxidoreductase [Nocardioides sp.]|nr:NAD(P)/FAD-dependent oxidoreductase [Nocardioides sp.]